MNKRHLTKNSAPLLIIAIVLGFCMTSAGCIEISVNTYNVQIGNISCSGIPGAMNPPVSNATGNYQAQFRVSNITSPVNAPFEAVTPVETQNYLYDQASFSSSPAQPGSSSSGGSQSGQQPSGSSLFGQLNGTPPSGLPPSGQLPSGSPFSGGLNGTPPQGQIPSGTPPSGLPNNTPSSGTRSQAPSSWMRISSLLPSGISSV
jgi:hypothetical protein